MDGTSGEGQRASGYRLNEIGYYEWSADFEEFGGYAVYLLSAGIDVQGYVEVQDGVSCPGRLT